MKENTDVIIDHETWYQLKQARVMPTQFFYKENLAEKPQALLAEKPQALPCISQMVPNVKPIDTDYRAWPSKDIE